MSNRAWNGRVCRCNSLVVWLRAWVAAALFVGLAGGAAPVSIEWRDAAPRLPKVVVGSVVHVVDGDTMVVASDVGQLRVRVAAIDAPEMGQVFGPQAAVAGQQLLLGQHVSLGVQSMDRYGRVVASVALPDGRDYGYCMVRAGWAWWYKCYAEKRGDLGGAQALAQGERAGLWADVGATPPWVWRSGHKR
jgi:micrococcal nuclease